MAYRFLLEVPERFVADATEAVDRTGDAQVVLTRAAHGLGYDVPYIDLTVAAHTLRVVESVYDWFDSMGTGRPDIRIVPHGGERIALESVGRSQVVAAIRRDQPWVERTLPKIGEHEPDDAARARAQAIVDADAGTGRSAPGGAENALVGGENPARAGASALALSGAAQPARRIRLRAFNHLAIKVQELDKAETFYTGFFGMELLGRAMRGAKGGYVPAPADYDHAEAIRLGQEADVTFLRSEALTLALQRAGRDARIERNAILDHVSVGVDVASFTELRGEVLIRNFNVLMVGETALTFRDPFGVIWEITIDGTPGAR